MGIDKQLALNASIFFYIYRQKQFYHTCSFYNAHLCSYNILQFKGICYAVNTRCVKKQCRIFINKLWKQKHAKCWYCFSHDGLAFMWKLHLFQERLIDLRFYNFAVLVAKLYHSIKPKYLITSNWKQDNEIWSFPVSIIQQKRFACAFLFIKIEIIISQ